MGTVGRIRRVIAGRRSSRAPTSAGARPAFSSTEYWERRYAKDKTSGAGSRGRLALFKAEVVNDLVVRHGIRSILEWGSGDGVQSRLLEVERYVGVDPSPTVVARCVEESPGDHFTYLTIEDWLGAGSPSAECGLSLDVIFHLVEDPVYEEYMGRLFGSAERLFVIYASNNVPRVETPPHVRHRAFTSWVAQHAPHWRLVEFIPNRYPLTEGDDQDCSFADFYVYANA
jgi:hypothetical protein